jgi:hypothetical protein
MEIPALQKITQNYDITVSDGAAVIFSLNLPLQWNVLLAERR